MKLAEALQERADLNKKISQIGERLADNCFVQEGERPAEEPARLLDELEAAVSRLELLIAAINATNNVTKVNGRTLTETIARKDCLILRINTLEQLISKASASVTRYTRREILCARWTSLPCGRGPMPWPRSCACLTTVCRRRTGRQSLSFEHDDLQERRRTEQIFESGRVGSLIEASAISKAENVPIR